MNLMRSLVMIFFVSYLSHVSYSQNFAPIGAKWKIAPSHEVSWHPLYPYYFFNVDRDTLIEGRRVSVLEVEEGNINVTSLKAYVYEESGRVYFYEDGEFMLVFDFNLSPGDTLFFRVPRTWNTEPEELPVADTIYRAIVDSVDYVEVDGVTLKRLHTSTTPESIGIEVELGIVTERFGSEFGMFGKYGFYTAKTFNRIFLCYEDSLVNYAIGDVACDYPDNNIFAPTGATWYFEDYSDCSDRSFFRIESEEYPFVPDFRWRLLQAFHAWDTIPYGGIFMAQEYGQIWTYHSGKYRRLYDFNLQTGDTMRFHLPFNRQIADFTCFDSFFLSPQYEVLVDSVSFQIIDGIELKSLHTSPLGDNCIDMGVITERLGSEYGLFGKQCEGCSGCNGHFRCYFDNDITYMASTEACDYTTSTQEDKLSNDLYLFPNPADQIIHIGGVSASELESINVYDSFGRLRHTQKGRSIEVSDCPAGLYLVEVYFSNKSYLLRFVKQ